MLFIPADGTRFLEKASKRGADAIILDLEDGVLASEKERARGLVEAAAKKLSADGCDVLVRINAPLRLAVRDIEAAVSPDVTALVLPKVEGAESIRLLSQVTAEVEVERGMATGSTGFFVLVESPLGYLRLGEIVAADRRVTAIALGTGDFSLSTGIHPDPDNLAIPTVQLVVTAKAAGVIPMGLAGVVDDFTDLEKFRQVAQRSRQLGLRGAPCIHPRQVPILNQAFSPTEDEVERARRVVVAFESEKTRGQGAIQVEGKMVDSPVVEGARQLLRDYEMIQQQEAARRTLQGG